MEERASKYEAPAIVEIGTVSELTLGRRVKLTQHYDGFVNGANASIGQETDPIVS